MKKLYPWGILVLSLVLGRTAQAQAGHCSDHCPRCLPDTTVSTERNNQLAAMGGAVLLYNRNRTPFGGLDLEVGYAVRPRLTLGLHGLLTARTASATDYGAGTTAPALSYHSLAGVARYQFLNTRRWRLEGVAGLGLCGVQLSDRNQEETTEVYDPNLGTYVTYTQPATVAYSLHPLLETGVAASYKLKRHVWLTSRLSYSQLPGRHAFGQPGEFSHWVLSVGAALPWGGKQAVSSNQ